MTRPGNNQARELVQWVCGMSLALPGADSFPQALATPRSAWIVTALAVRIRLKEAFLVEPLATMLQPWFGHVGRRALEAGIRAAVLAMSPEQIRLAAWELYWGLSEFWPAPAGTLAPPPTFLDHCDEQMAVTSLAEALVSPTDRLPREAVLSRLSEGLSDLEDQPPFRDLVPLAEMVRFRRSLLLACSPHPSRTLAAIRTLEDVYERAVTNETRAARSAATSHSEENPYELGTGDWRSLDSLGAALALPSSARPTTRLGRYAAEQAAVAQRGDGSYATLFGQH